MNQLFCQIWARRVITVPSNGLAVGGTPGWPVPFVRRRQKGKKKTVELLFLLATDTLEYAFRLAVGFGCLLSVHLPCKFPDDRLLDSSA